MSSPAPALLLIAVVFQLVEGAGVVAALLNDPSLHFLKLLLLEGQLSQLTMQGTTHCQGRKREVVGHHTAAALALEPCRHPLSRHQIFDPESVGKRQGSCTGFPQVDAACSTFRLPVSCPKIILWCSEDAKLSGYRQCEG